MYLDPELAAVLPTLPDLHIADLPEARTRMRAFADRAPRPEHDDVVLTVETVPATGSGPAVRVLVASPPPDVARPLPALLVLHGGGFVMGAADMTAPQIAHLCAELGAMVVAVDYRLAPEHPYPAALDDCAAGLAWLTGRTDVDRDRVGVYGMSAGGGLAAALTLLVRDRGGPAICFQLLDAPEVDDRLDTPSMHTFTDTPLWSRPDAELSWRHYLSGTDPDMYAAPARATDLSELPPAYISVYENDPLRDEGLAYAAQLLRAGVSVELHLFPGTFHRSVVVADAAVSRRQAAETLRALRGGLGP
ncbi:alpha/beta hydrolase [Pseudonocardia parietis]|uniref:Acetyl esterase/lipase n=1 Tax=Pseudonocardia parietis TaxID=570936 RepID=A0ABS4VX20_9PSEU|nr:alpha/beta hydrolase [Pseudonocardia parietis]MBP2368485.1 acetyl esterase/lipase [Pseudonocardia parietis]